MVDRITSAQRSALMAGIRSRNTAPELVVRRLLRKNGSGYRLHRRDLPGSPDVVLPRTRLTIFVHGCFWHGHCCPKGKLPNTRQSFWAAKIAANRQRDARNIRALRQLGWAVAIVWECETFQPENLAIRLDKLLARRQAITPEKQLGVNRTTCKKAGVAAE
jgi:DNA mismatch endonuclease (patch repair protein)